MSNSESSGTDVPSTEDFAGMTPAEQMDAATDAAAEAADAAGSGGFMPDWLDTAERVKGAADRLDVGGLIHSKGDGVPREDVAERLGCGDGPATFCHHATRAIGVDEIPPLFGMAVGAVKTIRDRAR